MKTYGKKQTKPIEIQFEAPTPKLFPLFRKSNIISKPSNPTKRPSSTFKISSMLQSSATRKVKTQLLLDFGQELQVTCKECQMTYFKSNEQDIKQHESIYLNHGIVYHSKMMKPFVFPNWKPDWVIHQEENDIFITVQVNLLSVHQRRKLNEILDSMEMMKEDISNMVAFLLLKDRYCIGCLLIDLTVKKGFELMDNELSNLETQVCCGVSRMWVHTTFRRKGYGLKLLHVFKNHYHLKVQDVAFSSLTPQGLKLASRFTDHVYIYCDLND